MNKLITSFLVCLGFVAPGYSESLLKPTSFPKTFEDMSFSERVQFKTDDYELYQAEYDDNGFCIKNCAYPGLNIKHELEKSDDDTRQSVVHSQQYESQNTQPSLHTQVHQEPQAEPQHDAPEHHASQNIPPIQQIQTLPVNTQNIVSVISSTTTTSSGHCANRDSEIPTGQKVPWGEPLKGKPQISSSYGPRRLEGKNGFHDGIDYAVGVGTAVYVPADGKVVRVINDSRCGKGLRIQHEDGTQTIYCHLRKQLVSKGVAVGAGCQIAESGNTGHSTGPHLHYGMRDSHNNKIDPSAYTKRAK